MENKIKTIVSLLIVAAAIVVIASSEYLQAYCLVALFGLCITAAVFAVGYSVVHLYNEFIDNVV